MLSISPNIAEDAISSGVARCQYHPPFRVSLLFSSLLFSSLLFSSLLFSSLLFSSLLFSSLLFSSLGLFWLSFLLPSVLRPRFTALDFHLFSIVSHVAFFCILD
ncbi:hypothetical protein FOXG_18615 [Fusarium oxysporum f. sp. lycopersici 4287]|uniref:Transmembrane protein n=1 Tax=Fusarium oxysporum f. sp. lycopersici (strain 4287 / CBS 123668 / FGSC 9935 / NRRL 34936) TaxID=426428 RepID=A0A0J9UKZ3_FUSO4|nr:hypothetical protein FOXG_18615 [Fusarium oxysporum f. sp. lycopersici 4287]XP_018237951.1 hypothetical protein FOXG_18615 [Fusarium oxysporum f. sp. lycopersici 4287]XP_018237952.1 hypothetical protein FOXG_18615 [Fusarium oxysporum f. sp. lycopersici 4287]XP_018237953.1 hypothetical protein FOXG_18615 [Fusarium oxysporum f. sp. lycopersici 4287]XP_018237954.1 hypothetical protein FOXG_18615 [Fusarium oxysporum f. sp. lycopersici 4287]XP_018237955.1 hypothetical protein FOXG_18615 [Fusariu